LPFRLTDKLVRFFQFLVLSGENFLDGLGISSTSNSTKPTMPSTTPLPRCRTTRPNSSFSCRPCGNAGVRGTASCGRAVMEWLGKVIRESSVIENLNIRLRNYIFLLRHLGADYLALLQCFLTHRRFVHSEYPERAGKNLADLLTSLSQPHWLELLRCKPFY